MNIDMHFVILLSTLVVIIESYALFMQYRSIKIIDKSNFFWWTLSSFFYLFAFVTGYLRNISSLGYIAIVLNNFLSVSAITSSYIGTIKYYKEYEVKKWHFFYVGIATVIATIFTYFNYNLQIRSINSSLFIGIMAILTARAIYKNCDFRNNFSKLLFRAFFLYGLFYLFRAFVYFKDSDSGLFSSSGIQVTTSIVFLLFSIIYTFSYILMLNYKLTSKTIEDKENLEVIFNTSPEIFMITRRSDGKIVLINNAFLRILGYSQEDILGKKILDLEIWNSVEERKEYSENVENIDNFEIGMRKKNKEVVTCLLSANIISIAGEEHIISILRDIDTRKKLEKKLLESENFLSDIIENNPALIYAKDLEGKYRLVNKKWEDLIGKKSEEVIGRKDLEIFEEISANIAIEVDSIVMNEMTSIEQEEKLIIANDTKYFLSTKFPIKDKDDKISGICGISIEITKQKDYEEKIEKLVEQLEIEKEYAQLNSITDGLTRISNRRHFDDFLRKEFYSMKRTGLPLSVVIIDIDFFKKYNDTYGHQSGDECLKKVAETLKKTIQRETDLVARYGGEEFVIVLPNTEQSGALLIAEKVREAVEELNIAHESSLVSNYVTISLGVATGYRENLSYPEQVITFADEALYRAKEEGRNRIRVSESLNKIENKSNLVKLSWNRADECGNDIIDSEHKKLIHDGNKLISAMIDKKGEPVCRALLFDLIEDIKDHFESEEKVFLETKYPYIENHIISHKNLLKKAEELISKSNQGKLNLGDVVSFVIYEVVAQHLAIEDKGYFPYVHSIG